MTKQMITDLADLRPGDSDLVVRVNGDEVHGGTVAVDERGALVWSHTLVVRWPNGSRGMHVAFVSATREVPDFPTEPGTAVTIYATKGEGVLLEAERGEVLRNGRVATPAGVYNADSITSWSVDTVIAGERVSR